MKKVYRNPVAVLKAAIAKIGGRLATYDGTPVLARTQTNLSGRVETIYLNAHEAAERANLTYSPRDEEL